jgi:hypothetical protein
MTYEQCLNALKNKTTVRCLSQIGIIEKLSLFEEQGELSEVVVFLSNNHKRSFVSFAAIQEAWTDADEDLNENF